VSTATRSHPTAPRSNEAPSDGLSRPLRVTVPAEDYEALLRLARRDFRKVEWQASYLLRQAILAAAREEAAGAC
jgi:hypothetical protein